MNYKKQYDKWVEKQLEDKDLICELNDMKNDDEKIKESFFKNLEFGTGGLRGVIGAGTNCVNIYTIRKATQGFSDYLNNTYSEDISVSISFDSRNKSFLFAKECAKVLAANSIKCYITDTLMPTPFLSFSVRHFKSKGGIMITASHNPFIYNGYKAYDENGCQLTDKPAKEVIDFVNKLDIFEDVKTIDFEDGKKQGLIKVVGEEIYELYLNEVLDKKITSNIEDNLKIVYTPLNGAGNIPVNNILQKIGCKNVKIVKEQQDPDGNFTTCQYPNPEIKEAIQLALDLASKERADIILATDPDCDRVGVSVPYEGDFKNLTGNEIGILMLDYVINNRIKDKTMPKNPIVVKTIVSSNLINKICQKNAIECIDVLTGFKYIGEQIENLYQKNEQDRFIFGYEESFGYLTDGFVRDKDAVLSAMHIVKMAQIYKNEGKKLTDRLDEIYKQYGYIYNSQKSYTFEGISGIEKMQKIMNNLRNISVDKLNDYDILNIKDYLISVNKDVKTNKIGIINLPKSNVIELQLSEDASIIVRPSGTEPKIKAYLTANGMFLEKNKEIVKDLEKISDDIMGCV
ncbi:MAG: phospho-sugar mutase [Oscillospiraceae bacterium]